jgi:ketosteroid isomerase-like protein
MKKMMMLLWVMSTLITGAYACGDSAAAGEKNIATIKAMFTEFAEKRDVSKMDNYYTKDFKLESNGTTYNYQQYKEMHEGFFKTLKSLSVTRYTDMFATADKVASRMWIKLVNASGDSHEFQVVFIAGMKDGKIDRLVEVTYPAWNSQPKAESDREKRSS